MEIVYESIQFCEFIYGSIWFCEFINKLGRFEYWFRMLYWNVGKAFEGGSNFSGACMVGGTTGGAQQQRGSTSRASAAGRCFILTLFT
jgi:hypothetical protein